MSSRALRAALIAPLFAYWALLLAPVFASLPPVALAVALAMVLSNGLYLIPRLGPPIGGWVVVAGAALAAVGIVPLLAPAAGAIAGPLSPAIVGFFVGSVFVAAGPLILSDTDAGGLLFELEGTVLDGILLVGALAAAGSAPLTASTLLSAYAGEIAGQIRGWFALLTGGSPGILPLEGIGTVALIALAGLAFLGVLLTVLIAPPAEWQAPRSAPSPRDPVPLPPHLEAIARRGSDELRDPEGWPPGAAALIAGGGLAAALLAVAAWIPVWSLLVLGLAVVGFVTATAALSLPGKGNRRPDPAAADPVPSGGAASAGGIRGE
ncbi:MAG: hypothetical protein QXG65_03340 [Thermoplasmata archaeon]